MEEKQSLYKFIEFISAVAKKPAIYQISNVDGIYAMIFGYIAGSQSEILNVFHQNFRTFVNEYFASDFVIQGDYNWPRLFRFYSASESHSVELFLQVFEQFINSQDL
ncbi:hypothetical protein [Mucilaginibacter sp. R-33]|uniref:hypothetical protein n=1 Tax=Mucilaginibacter sp. R-33 TaxID=3416711 RepID=UPI003CF8F19B